MHVNPENIAGVQTAESAIRRWNGHRMEDKVEVEISGQFVAHICWLIPRLPLEVRMSAWLSVDSDDLIHLPSADIRPFIDSNAHLETGIPASQQLLKHGFFHPVG